MKNVNLVLGLCAVAAGRAMGSTFVVPHVLEGGGHITSAGLSSPLPLSLSSDVSIDITGPDATGAYLYTYSGPIRYTGTDFEGRAFELDYNVLQCRCAPTNGAFQMSMQIDPVLVSLNGHAANVHGSPFDLSAVTASADPIGRGISVDFAMTARRYVTINNSSADFAAGNMRLVPAPISAALLGIASIFSLAKRHRI